MSLVDSNGSLIDPYKNFIAISRYARWSDELGRRETWTETVNRYITYMKNHVTKNHPGAIEDEFWAEAEEAIVNHKVMPSMRALMTAGPALERSNVAGYNCSFMPIDSPRAFDEALYILMNGTGLGFSAERKYTEKLPVVNEHFERSNTIVRVADSKEGWARALRELIAMLYVGQIPAIDVTAVRPAGARLKTFGGRSSGPQPLVNLFDFTIELFKRAAGRQLSSLECHDLVCKIAEVVVVGGVRRSALISLQDLNDYDMAKAKSGAWWESHPERMLANNSATYYKKPSVGEFLNEWRNLYESKSGERGIVNMENMQKAAYAPRRDGSKLGGTNPCGEIALRPYQFCVTPDTPLITKDGIYNIGELRDQQVEIWNGEEWSEVTVRRTRKDAEVVRVTLSDGSYLDCTPDHRFSAKNRFSNKWEEVQAKDLVGGKYVMQLEPTTITTAGGREIDLAYTLGFVVGDGHVYNDVAYVDLYGEKDFQCPVEGVRYKEYMPKGYNVSKVRVRTDVKPEMVSSIRNGGFRELAEWSRESVLSFFAGLADADGSNVSSGGIRIYISGEQNARDAQLVLTKNGIRSSVNLCQRAGTVTNKGVRTKDLWYLQITDAREIPVFRLDVSRGHSARFKGKYQTVRSVERLAERSDVYCFNEPKRHMAVFANVFTYQCNLTEIIVEESDDLESLSRKAYIATVLGTIQSSFTNFKYLRKIWKDNCEEERLLGVSLTGQFGNKLMSGAEGLDNLANSLDELRQVCIEANATVADALGINRSTAITTVKPSGTVSQLTGTSSGMHPWHNEHYIRSVRQDNKDPLTSFMYAAGIPSEPAFKAEDTTTVFYFPQKAPEGAVTRKDLTAIQHLEFWRTYKEHWTEHNPSITVNVREDEWIDVGRWVYENWDIVGGISFLPYDDHVYQQAPYQDTDESGYRQFVSEMPKSIDWSIFALYEKTDNTSSTQTLSCTSGACDLVGSGN